METTIEEKIKASNADPDFIQFVIARHGEIGAATAIPFAEETRSPAYQRKIQRWTRRDFGSQWKWYWKRILNDCWKARRDLVLQRNLFTLEPRGPNAAHRPRNEGRWNAIFDLRTYFTRVTGRPQMDLLRRLFYPNQDEVTFNKEWDSRKDWFEHENGADRLERLELFYKHNRTRILETLQTGIPFYAKWESRAELPDRSFP